MTIVLSPNALRGVKVALERILSEEDVKLREECHNCHKDMKLLGRDYECKCGVVKLQETLE